MPKAEHIEYSVIDLLNSLNTYGIYHPIYPFLKNENKILMNHENIIYEIEKIDDKTYRFWIDSMGLTFYLEYYNYENSIFWCECEKKERIKREMESSIAMINIGELLHQEENSLEIKILFKEI